jgi:hypothetical protein
MMAQQPDRVRQYLRRRGCTPSVVKGGFEGLVNHWESAVEAVADGYDLSLGDYLSDMEMRDVLAGALDVTNGEQRTAAERRIDNADQRFRELTVDCSHVCGDQVALENGHDPGVQWWYYRRPRQPAPDFEEELREAGLV